MAATEQVLKLLSLQQLEKFLDSTLNKFKTDCNTTDSSAINDESSLDNRDATNGWSFADLEVIKSTLHELSIRDSASLTKSLDKVFNVIVFPNVASILEATGEMSEIIQIMSKISIASTPAIDYHTELLQESDKQPQLVEWTSSIARIYPVELGIPIIKTCVDIVSTCIFSALHPSLNTFSIFKPDQSTFNLIHAIDILGFHGTVWNLYRDQPHSAKELLIRLKLISAIIMPYTALDNAEPKHEFVVNQKDVELASSKLLVLSLVLLSSSVSVLRTYAGNTMLPLIFKWILRDLGVSTAAKWAKTCWKQIQFMCSTLPNTHAIHSEIAGYLCRLFDPWMGIDKSSSGKPIFTFEHMLIDLRYENLSYHIIQIGLCSSDSAELKYSQFLMKRFIHFSKSFSMDKALNQDAKKWTAYLSWPKHDASQAGSQTMKRAIKMWENYFLMFDTVQEPYVHLVDPIISKILQLLDTNDTDSHPMSDVNLHPSWWIVLLHRGIYNQSHPIRKRMLDMVLSVRSRFLLEVLASHLDFTIEALLSQVDEPSQFAVPGLGIFISPFGEKLAEFIVSLGCIMNTSEKCREFLTRLIKATRKFTTRVGVIFILQGLAMLGTHPKCPPVAKCLFGEDVNDLVSLIVGERAVSMYKNLKTRDLICSFGLSILETLVDPNAITFDVAARTIAEFAHDTCWFDYKSNEYARIHRWLLMAFPDHYMITMFESNLRSYLQPKKNNLQPNTVNTTNQNALEKAATRNLASMSHFLLTPTSPADISIDSKYITSTALAPLYDVLARLRGPYLDCDVSYNAIMMLGHLVYFSLQSPAQTDLGMRTIDRLEDQPIRAVSIYAQTVDTDTAAIIIAFIERELQNGVEIPLYMDMLVVIYEALVVASASRNNCVSVQMQLNAVQISVCEYLSCFWTNELESLDSLYSFYGQVKLYAASLRILNYISTDQDGFITQQDVALGRLMIQVDPTRSMSANASMLDTLTKTKAKFSALRYKVVYEIITAASRSQCQCLSLSSAPRKELVSSDTLLDMFVLAVNAMDGALVSSCCSLMQLSRTVLDLYPSCVNSLVIEEAAVAGMQILQENWSSSKWWPKLMDAYVDISFHPSVLANKAFMCSEKFVNKNFNTMIKWGNSRVGVMNYPATKLYQFWLHAVSSPNKVQQDDSLATLSLESMIENMDWVVNMVLYGPLRDSDTLDLKHEAMIALKLTKDKLDLNEIDELKGTAAWNFSSKDYIVRVQMNDILLRLSQDHKGHQILAKKLLMRLITIQLECTHTNQFINSSEQRGQLRAWTTMHILLSFIDSDDMALTYMNYFIKAIVIEQLAETRSYIEWAVARLLILYPSLHPIFWKHLTNFDYRAHVISSLLTISLHVGEHLPILIQETFFRDAFVSLVPWVASNHFNMRLFAQYGLFKLWNYCLEKPYLTCLTDEMSNVSVLMEFIKSNPECIRHRAKCTSYYFVGGGFDPIRDVNIEFLFRGGPCVLQLADDEKICVMAFTKVNPSQGYSIPTGYDRRELIRSMVSSSIKLTSKSLETAGACASRSVALANTLINSQPTSNENKDGSEDTFGESSQKKILAWETLMQTNVDLSTEREAQAARVRNPLVVVASLISKVPNLGGLCRTCEIFNAELLVVNNIKIKEDQVFSNTSVSADKWMPIKQVREEDLETYLIGMKTRGYTVVGVEQATRSVSLNGFEFPRKTVVLLGKEREGIPTHLMAHLDHVLEIPQFGVIRSLNVHVSGALIVWEYTKQQGTGPIS
ncbi:hypothetical protein BDV3_004449 [Batrachochytrium dendrobatidis]